MKIVFGLAELAEEIEDAAGRLFEEQGGVLGDAGLTLSRINVDTQELLFTTDGQPEAEIIDMSPTVTDDAVLTEDDVTLADDVNPDA